MKFNCAYSGLIDIHKVVPNPKNPNKHSDEQILRLSEIIDYQGQRSPIVISKRTGFVTKGHGRLCAMQKLNWQQVAVDYQEYEDEAQEYADIVADNAIAEWSQLDIGQINQDFLDLGPELDIEMLGSNGYKIAEIIDVVEALLSEQAKDKYSVFKRDALKSLKEASFSLYLEELDAKKIKEGLSKN